MICEAISKQDDSTGLTQRLGFKQSNTDFLKISCSLALPFRLSSSKWKALYWAECYVNC